MPRVSEIKNEESASSKSPLRRSTRIVSVSSPIPSEVKPVRTRRGSTASVESKDEESAPRVLRGTRASSVTSEGSNPQPEPAKTRGRRLSTSSIDSTKEEKKPTSVRGRRSSATSEDPEIDVSKPLRGRRASTSKDEEKKPVKEKNSISKAEVEKSKELIVSLSKCEDNVEQRVTRSRRVSVELSEENEAKKEAPKTPKPKRRPSLSDVTVTLDRIEEVDQESPNKVQVTPIKKKPGQEIKANLDLSAIKETSFNEDGVLNTSNSNISVSPKNIKSNKEKTPIKTSPNKSLNVPEQGKTTPDSPARRSPRLINKCKSGEKHTKCDCDTPKKDAKGTKLDFEKNEGAPEIDGLVGTIIEVKDNSCKLNTLENDKNTSVQDETGLNDSKSSNNSDKENQLTNDPKTASPLTKKNLMETLKNEVKELPPQSAVVQRVSNVFRPKGVEISFMEPMEVDVTVNKSLSSSKFPSENDNESDESFILHLSTSQKELTKRRSSSLNNSYTISEKQGRNLEASNSITVKCGSIEDDDVFEETHKTKEIVIDSKNSSDTEIEVVFVEEDEVKSMSDDYDFDIPTDEEDTTKKEHKSSKKQKKKDVNSPILNKSKIDKDQNKKKEVRTSLINNSSQNTQLEKQENAEKMEQDVEKIELNSEKMKEIISEHPHQNRKKEAEEKQEVPKANKTSETNQGKEHEEIEEERALIECLKQIDEKVGHAKEATPSIQSGREEEIEDLEVVNKTSKKIEKEQDIVKENLSKIINESQGQEVIEMEDDNEIIEYVEEESAGNEKKNEQIEIVNISLESAGNEKKNEEIEIVNITLESAGNEKKNEETEIVNITLKGSNQNEIEELNEQSKVSPLANKKEKVIDVNLEVQTNIEKEEKKIDIKSQVKAKENEEEIESDLIEMENSFKDITNEDYDELRNEEKEVLENGIKNVINENPMEEIAKHDQSEEQIEYDDIKTNRASKMRNSTDTSFKEMKKNLISPKKAAEELSKESETESFSNKQSSSITENKNSVNVESNQKLKKIKGKNDSHDSSVVLTDQENIINNKPKIEENQGDKMKNLLSQLDEFLEKKLEEKEGLEEEEESQSEDNSFIDDMAEEGEEDTPSEDSNAIIDEGESIHSDSVRSEEEVNTESDSNSFICDEENFELLSGEEYDLGGTKAKKSRIINIENRSEDIIIIDKKEKPIQKKKKKSRIIPMNDSSSDEDVETLKPLQTNRRSSINIIENVDIKDIKDATLSERINQIVDTFCTTIPDKGDVSMNLSLEFAAKRLSKEKDSSNRKRKSSEKIKALPSEEPSCSNSNLEQDVIAMKNVETNIENVSVKKPRLSVSMTESPKIKVEERRLSQSMDEAKTASKKRKRNKKTKRLERSASNNTSSSEDLKIQSLGLMNQLINDVKNRPKREIKPSYSKLDVNSGWQIEKASNMKPSTSIVSEDEIQSYKKIKTHPKDFRNQMLYQSNRVKRVETKQLLRKKGLNY